MNPMAYYNDIDFSNIFEKFHPGDHSLVCRNNILYYLGDTTSIVGSCGVTKGECINLNEFKIRTIDNQVWKLSPHLLYFNVRETVVLHNLDVNDQYSKLNQINAIASKNILNVTEESIIESFMDYYCSLKSIEPYLRNNLLDTYNRINQYVINEAKKMNSNNITQGYRIIYEKAFGELKDAVNQIDDGPSQGLGVQRTRFSGNTPKPIAPLYIPKAEEENKLNQAAFTYLFLILFIIVSTIAAVITFLLS